MDAELTAAWPVIKQVFLDPTRADPELAARTRAHFQALQESVAPPERPSSPTYWTAARKGEQ
jgi:hypothetical protein